MFPDKPLASDQTPAQDSTAASTWEKGGECPASNKETQILELNKSTTTTVGDVLSAKQLFLRRGLALLLMVVLLVAGIVLSEVLIRLLK